MAVLVLVNGLVLAWWQGWLSPLLDPPGMSEREPLRVARQLRPEAIRVAPPRSIDEATGESAAAAASGAAASASSASAPPPDAVVPGGAGGVTP